MVHHEDCIISLENLKNPLSYSLLRFLVIYIYIGDVNFFITNQSLTKLWDVNNQLLLLGHVGLNFLFFIPWFYFYMFAIVSSSVMLIVTAQIYVVVLPQSWVNWCCYFPKYDCSCSHP